MASIKHLNSGKSPAKEAGNSVCDSGPLNWTYGADAILETKGDK